MTKPIAKRLAAFSETAIDGEVVLLNLGDGTFFSLTGTAATIWQLIDGSRNREAVLASLVSAHAAGPDTIEADLDAFLAQLREAGFIDPS